MKDHKRSRITSPAAVALAAVLLFSTFLLAACGGGGDGGGGSASGSTASDMKMEDLQGTVGVNDGTDDVEAFAGMNLYDGYRIGTEQQSYSWILLDAAKLVKMNQNSHTSISQEGKKLKITLDEGDLFFCVTEELEEDEELTFETSNMTMSIRGTTGIIRVEGDRTMVVLLEGRAHIDVKDSDKSFSFNGPEVRVITGGKAPNTQVGNGDVPDFARNELLNNEMVRGKIEQEGVSTDYASDEEIRTNARRFVGRYLDTTPVGSKGEGPDFFVYNPGTLEISLSEDGVLRVTYQESEETYNAIENYNQAVSDLGPEHQMEHKNYTYETTWIVMRNPNELDCRVDGFPYIELDEDGNLNHGRFQRID